MKSLLTIVYLLLLFLTPFFQEEEIPDTFSESPAAVTTMAKICGTSADFASSYGTVCPPNGYIYLTVDENCIGRGTAYVRAANLDPNPVVDHPYNLPQGVFPIYYKYTVLSGWSSVIGPIESFEFKGDYYPGTSSPIFEFTSEIVIDISDDCVKNGSLTMPLTVELLDGPLGSIYPVGLYAQPDDIFSCEIFEETCNYCLDPSLSGCNGGYPPVYSFTTCSDCSICFERDNSSNFDESENFVNEDTKKIKDNILIRPNPFSNILTIQCQVKSESELRVEIFSANGVIIQELNPSPEEGNLLLDIDTSHLLSGIYFCRIHIDSETFTKKIIKID